MPLFHNILYFLPPQIKFAKVMFSHVSVCPQGVAGGGGMRGREACVMGSMRGGEACMERGCAWQGTCMEGGWGGGDHALQEGCAWQEGGHAQRGVDVVNVRAVHILLECILV